jgi:deoxyribose-phosphate aldolase
MDVSVVQMYHSIGDIDELIEKARTHLFINVHVLPCWVRNAAELLKGQQDILVGAPVGFPSGAHRTEVKLLEARLLVQDGVQEMDLVMNIGKLKSGEYRSIIEEIKAIDSIADGRPLKVIIEINCLKNDEIKKACELIIQGGADYVKTGTGWFAGEAKNEAKTFEKIRMIADFVGSSIKIKAAGGIRTVEQFLRLYQIGVSRMGINLQSSLDILSQLDPESD